MYCEQSAHDDFKVAHASCSDFFAGLFGLFKHFSCKAAFIFQLLSFIQHQERIKTSKK